MADQTSTYDGFISYSHAADDLLAPRLQSALQRFAKPWWKRRAVRIFRDESSLSANPHLWSSITEALDTSGWFVLLLSPDAAQSEWVNQEIAYWVEHRDPKKILPVVTNGEFGWSNGDVTGDAVPEALQGVLTEEPRWVDLRFARHEEQLDLQHPEFNSAIADIASTIRGISKDDLASEEVRQHRRTVRTAWAAGGLVTVLAIAAAGFGIQSSRNADEAERQAEIAAEQAEIAQANAEAEAQAREDADANAAAEAEARESADQNARLARSRELSAAAISVLEDDPALATRLVVHAASIVGSDEVPAAVADALWRAGAAEKLVDVVDLGETLYTSIALSADGSLLAAAQASTSLAFPDVRSTGRLVVMETGTLEPVWEWLPDAEEGVVIPTMSPDGRFVAVGVEAASDAEPQLGRIEVFDLRTGDSEVTIEYPGCVFPGAPAWSPDGAVLGIATSLTPPCQRPESSTGRWLELVDTETWQSIRVDELPDTDLGSHPEWSDDGRLYVFGSHVPYRYADGFSRLEPLPGIAGFGDVSPDGTLLATFNLDYAPGQGGLAIFDTETLERVDLLPWEGFPRFPLGIKFTDDSKSLLVAPEGAKTNLFNVGDGDIELTLPTGETDGVLRDEATGRIYTSHNDGTIKVWSAAYAAYGLEWLEDLGAASWVNGSNSFNPGDGITAFDHFDFDGDARYLTFFDQATGEFVADPVETYFPAEPTADGRFAVLLEPTVLVSIDPRSGETLSLYEAGVDMWFTVSMDGDEIAVGGFQGDPFRSPPEWWATIDPNGAILEEGELPEIWPITFDEDTILGEDPVTRELLAVDRTTGDELWREAFNFFQIQVTEYGLEGLGKTSFRAVDIRTGEATAFPVAVDRPRGFEVSPSRDRLAVGDVEQIRIFDAEAGVEVQTIPVPGVSDIHWIDEDTIVIGSRDGVWARLSLDTGELLQEARQSIRSGFTESECQVYSIDPCPTLEEMGAG